MFIHPRKSSGAIVKDFDTMAALAEGIREWNRKSALVFD
jgi:hypothetical protein